MGHRSFLAEMIDWLIVIASLVMQMSMLLEYQAQTFMR